LDGHDGGTPATTSPDGPAAAAAGSSDGPAAAAAGHRARPLKRTGAAGDAATRRLRKEILAAVKQGPSPAPRRRRRPFSA